MAITRTTRRASAQAVQRAGRHFPCGTDSRPAMWPVRMHRLLLASGRRCGCERRAGGLRPDLASRAVGLARVDADRQRQPRAVRPAQIRLDKPDHTCARLQRGRPAHEAFRKRFAAHARVCANVEQQLHRAERGRQRNARGDRQLPVRRRIGQCLAAVPESVRRAPEQPRQRHAESVHGAAHTPVSPYIKGLVSEGTDYELRQTSTWSNATGVSAGTTANGSYTNDITAHLAQEPRPGGWRLEYDALRHPLPRAWMR